MEEGGTSLGPSFRNSTDFLGSTPKKVQKMMVKCVCLQLCEAGFVQRLDECQKVGSINKRKATNSPDPLCTNEPL